MARYEKFNFMFFVMPLALFEIPLYDAAVLSNFRVMYPSIEDIGGKKQIKFTPKRFTNNPNVFPETEDWSVWYEKDFFSKDFPVKRTMCFVIYEKYYRQFRRLRFFKFLRDNYPGCKLVLWINNTIKTCQQVRGMFVNEASTKEILSTFDVVKTYIQSDAEKYGLTYFEDPYSVLPFEETKETIDIFFVGKPKDRLEKIIRAYESFKSAGFICDFYVNGLTEIPDIKSEGLNFNVPIGYANVLNRIQRSRAILDITAEGNSGLTMRYFESLAYNKNFITDNPFYRQERFDSPKIFLIDESLDIDKDKFMEVARLPSNYRNEYSPLRFLSFLESVLNY